LSSSPAYRGSPHHDRSSSLRLDRWANEAGHRGKPGSNRTMPTIGCRSFWSMEAEACMTNTHDVAAEILRQYGRPISSMKLQKLVYYSQSWHLAWTGSPLFNEPIQAWAKGPVTPSLYEMHKGRHEVGQWSRGTPSKLTTTERRVVTAVMQTYGQRSARWLSAQTHRETPWIEARHGLPEGVRSTNEIPQDSMLRFYRALLPTAAS
jgi:uncharacterized phage-associated protein